MKTQKKRSHIILLLTVSLLTLVVASSFSFRNAHAAIGPQHFYYYGANLQKMAQATGVNTQSGTIAANAPWPQNAGNYCFTAVVQAIVNYNDLTHNLPMRYPNQNNEGPASGNPNDAVPGQILYDMDHFMIPQGGPLQPVSSGTTRRPFTLANVAYDFGGDPRSQAVGITYEMLQNGFSSTDSLYHQHVYHNGAQAATLGIARALGQYSEPVIALVNHAEHSVLVAGVLATANPFTDPGANISKFIIFNPWNEAWGTYLSTGNYAVVTYSDWVNATNLPSPYGGVNTWFNLPYSSNGTLDPDPSIGMYKTTVGGSYPRNWIGNYVFIQYDGFATSADFEYDENNNLIRP